MASIVGKKLGNKTYYYLVESARVGGKPRIVSQVYLGSAEEIADRLSGVSPGEPDRIREASFGALAGVWSVIERLGIAEIIDGVVGARRSDAAASVGTYIALAVANRVVAPRSKLAFAEWWGTTVGPRLLRLPEAALDHRRFWDAMDYLSTEDLVAAEEAITAAMVTNFDLDLSGLVLDMTNFATFVDSANARNTIAQRGHAKQKRYDLRLVGLALTVTRDGGVPIYSHAYEGNRPDVTQFAEAVKMLAARFRAQVGGDEGLTVVYDAGCDSADNQAVIEGAGLHFVGSLIVTNHPDLLAVPASEYKSLERKGFPGLSYYETRTKALGKDRRVIITHSSDFHDAQVRGLEQSLAKARRRLGELAARLGRGNTRRERPAVEAEIAAIVKDDRVGRVIRTTLTGRTPANLRLTWRSDATARRALEAEIFGKRILFTDHEDWAVTDVVSAYRSQPDVEAGFRQMKDRRVVGFSPMFHWTDQKIRVHAFYCVLALAVAHIMRRETERAGMAMSVRELLANLDTIKEVTLLYQGETGRPRARRMLTEIDPIPQRLYDLFGLDAYAPAR
ncbi:MAG TPA: IS1634 family transposase [Acidimicrobiales bacterium]|nr:IS1634 family transposase [Acidimicrobiales bacterium]